MSRKYHDREGHLRRNDGHLFGRGGHWKKPDIYGIGLFSTFTLHLEAILKFPVVVRTLNGWCRRADDPIEVTNLGQKN